MSSEATRSSRVDKPRDRALAVLRAVEQGVFTDALLDETRRLFDARDCAFITELVYGVLRNRERIDWSLNQFSKKPIEKTDDRTRAVLRLGAYQVLFLDRVPVSAAINTSVELAKYYGGSHGYVNGLLRNLDRNRKAVAWPEEPVRCLSVLYSHPLWLVRRWYLRFGAERTETILRENNRPAPLVIRANALKITKQELRASLEAEGATVAEVRYSSAGLEITSSPGIQTLSAYQKGLFIVQDEAAQLVGMMLDARPGEIVLDACAAPGGKATHLAEMMKNEGTLIALESDAKRTQRIRENSDRLGITIIRPALGDASAYRQEASFDKILIDAPCTGLGVLRRHPDGRWNKTERNIRERQLLQKRILDNCSKLLKPGGALVYATCTTEPEENEGAINSFLAEHPAFARDDPRQHLPPAAAKLVDDKGFFRTFPGEPALDGFFGARLVKKNNVD